MKSNAQFLQKRIEQYAQLLVECGVNIQEGQSLVISAPVECADFVRTVTEKAYERGASDVIVDWHDEVVSRLGYESKPMEAFEKFPSWKALLRNENAENGAAYLSLTAEDPDWARNVDPEKIKTNNIAARDACNVLHDKMNFGQIQWCIAGVPSEKWAAKVYPGIIKKFQPVSVKEMLWNAILDTARVPAVGGNATEQWKEHEQVFEERKKTLNGLNIKTLHYQNELGTDFTVDLPERAVWHGGNATTVDGVTFAPNIPTEEIYCSPDFRTANGVLYAAMPLVHNGQIIEDFWIRFENGRAVEWDAAKGKDTLTAIIETDEGSHHLGEVALVPFDSPIRNLGMLFYNTLYDENASSHVALGVSFPECIEGGVGMTRDELVENGLNDSKTHVDFMIGTEDLSISGITSNGGEFLIFENGNWAI